MSTPAWSTLYIYLHTSAEQMDEFLIDALAPLANELVLSGDATGWFFLRYWDGGPHFRVRIRDAAPQVVRDFAHVLRDAATASLPANTGFHARTFYQDFETAPAQPWSHHGEIRIATYQPETSRYGGFEALALAEDFFCFSSQVAIAVVTATRGRRDKRIAIGTDLLAVSAHVAAWDDAKLARQTRGYVYSWDFSGELRPADRTTIRLQAEQILRYAQAQWDARSHAARSAAESDGDNVYQQWRRELAAYVNTLLELQASRLLKGDLATILWSQIHMLHNRIGLSVDDECLIAWITSLQAEARQASRFPRADLTYLTASKYPHVRRPQAVVEHREVQRPWSPTPTFRLPAASEPSSTSLDAALKQRSSQRGDYGNRLPIQTIADLLCGAAGYRTETSRGYPSAGGLFAVDLYLQARTIDGLDSGLYYFDQSTSALVSQRAMLTDRFLARISPYLNMDGSEDRHGVALSTVPAILYAVVDLGRLRPKYGERSLRLALLEAGGLLQNLALCSAALGLKSTQISGYADDELNVALHLDNLDQFVTSIVPIGQGEKSRTNQ